jgi:hypothetical protein
MHFILMIYANNVLYSTKNKHIVFIVNKFISIPVMTENNGFYVKIVAGGFIVNALIMIQLLIQTLNV